MRKMYLHTHKLLKKSAERSNILNVFNLFSILDALNNKKVLDLIKKSQILF